MDFIFLTVYVADSLKPLMNNQLFFPHSTIIKTIKAKDTLILAFSRKIYIVIAIWVQALWKYECSMIGNNIVILSPFFLCNRKTCINSKSCFLLFFFFSFSESLNLVYFYNHTPTLHKYVPLSRFFPGLKLRVFRSNSLCMHSFSS